VSQLSVNTITNAAGGNTAQINGMTPTADSLQGFRNRLINSDMRIDQRNAGASVANVNGYSIDRWASYNSANSFSAQRSSTAPAGFSNSLLFTTTTSATPSASDYRFVGQFIEGFNVADLGWGTASAQTVTVSFLVRSSLTGSFSGALKNSAEDRSYPFSFTINAANTFEYKTVTIPGDTAGTWLTDNGIGLRIYFNLGSGSSRLGTANTWAASNFDGVTGTTALVATSGATFYITGVQLEAGSVATPFERRPYGTELALCQRYYQKLSGQFTEYGISGKNTATFWTFPVVMRATPTVVLGGGSISAGTETLSEQVFGVYNGSATSARIASGTTASSEL
jgi:hypothetical protein